MRVLFDIVKRRSLRVRPRCRVEDGSHTPGVFACNRCERSPNGLTCDETRATFFAGAADRARCWNDLEASWSFYSRKFSGRSSVMRVIVVCRGYLETSISSSNQQPEIGSDYWITDSWDGY